jgi:hypothetical protein
MLSQIRLRFEKLEDQLARLRAELGPFPGLQKDLQGLMGACDNHTSQIQEHEEKLRVLVQRADALDTDLRRITMSEDDLDGDALPALSGIDTDRERQRILTFIRAIDQLDRAERFDQAFKVLSIEAGCAFCWAVHELTESQLDEMLDEIHRWLTDRNIRYSYLMPRKGEGFDPKTHEPVGGLGDEQCVGTSIARILCWGILHESGKATASVVTRARVEVA